MFGLLLEIVCVCVSLCVCVCVCVCVCPQTLYQYSYGIRYSERSISYFTRRYPGCNNTYHGQYSRTAVRPYRALVGGLGAWPLGHAGRSAALVDVGLGALGCSSDSPQYEDPAKTRNTINSVRPAFAASCLSSIGAALPSTTTSCLESRCGNRDIFFEIPVRKPRYGAS